MDSPGSQRHRTMVEAFLAQRQEEPPPIVEVKAVPVVGLAHHIERKQRAEKMRFDAERRERERFFLNVADDPSRRTSPASKEKAKRRPP